VHQEGGFLFCRGADLTGGIGGANYVGWPNDPDLGLLCEGEVGGDGGPGLPLSSGPRSGAPAAELYDATLTGGGGGFAFLPFCSFGSPGPPSSTEAGSLSASSTPTRDFFIRDDVIDVGSDAEIELWGQAGDFAWYLVSGAPSALYVQPLSGTLAIDLTDFAPVAAGFLSVTGRTIVHTPVPSLLSLQATDFVLQPLYLDAAGSSFTLAAPASFVLR